MASKRLVDSAPSPRLRGFEDVSSIGELIGGFNDDKEGRTERHTDVSH
jgi:hypothetical protein